MAGAASAASPVSIVKVLSFGCSVCRASETHDAELKTAARLHGGQFAYAAMPPSLETPARELAYYAARDMGHEAQARQSLYKGSQDRGLPLSEPVQASVWLQDDIGLDGSTLSQGISGAKARDALDRALGLAAQGGVQRLPTYLLVRGGVVVATVVPGEDGLFALKTRVLAEFYKETSKQEQ
jgi:2-hydroxychromene-2-carboxylate isomerase